MKIINTWSLNPSLCASWKALKVSLTFVCVLEEIMVGVSNGVWGLIPFIWKYIKILLNKIQLNIKIKLLDPILIPTKTSTPRGRRLATKEVQILSENQIYSEIHCHQWFNVDIRIDSSVGDNNSKQIIHF